MHVRNPNHRLLIGFVMICGGLADVAIGPPYGLVLNGIFASGAILVAREGLRFAQTRRVRRLFLLELLTGALILVAVLVNLVILLRSRTAN